jgi:hypothetical protein
MANAEDMPVTLIVGRAVAEAVEADEVPYLLTPDTRVNCSKMGGDHDFIASQLEYLVLHLIFCR